MKLRGILGIKKTQAFTTGHSQPDKIIPGPGASEFLENIWVRKEKVVSYLKDVDSTLLQMKETIMGIETMTYQAVMPVNSRVVFNARRCLLALVDFLLVLLPPMVMVRTLVYVSWMKRLMRKYL